MLFFIFDYFMDVFITIVFFSIMFTKRKSSYTTLKITLTFSLLDFIPTIFSTISVGEHSVFRGLLNLLMSLSILFILSLMYESTMVHRFFISISFLTILSLSEIVSFSLNSLIIKDIQSLDNATFEMYISICSYLILIIIICFILLLKKKKRELSLSYGIYLLSTPTISLILTFVFERVYSLYSIDIKYSYYMLASIVVINIINYIMHNFILDNQDLINKTKLLTEQINTQNEDFQLLNNAYRNTRKTIHETKSALYLVKSQLENKENNKAIDTIDSFIGNLNIKYILINTGNLVIDSFLSNYIIICNKEGIKIDHNLKFSPNDVPLSDYDLCIVFRNLMQNAYEACRRVIDNEKKIYVHVGATDDFFIIKVENTFSPNYKGDNNKEGKLMPYYHGYGIENIKKITEENQGTYYSEKTDKYLAVVTFPIERDYIGNAIKKEVVL